MPNLKRIAHIESDFPDKFGIPRQSGLVEELKSRIIFEPGYRNPDALRGLEGFSHIWLIWGFSGAERDTWSPTVRPPRLGGNTRMGVFATRSPYRPNSLGLSSVRLKKIELHPELGPVIHVLGADIMNGSPIYDIKPYIPYADSHPEASAGFASQPPEPVLRVVMDEKLERKLPQEEGKALQELLAYDPRPSYQEDPDRIYKLAFAGAEVHFSVAGNVLTVLDITDAKK